MSGGAPAKASLRLSIYMIDKMIGLLPASSILLRIAGSHSMRQGDLVELDVTATGLRQFRDLVAEDAPRSAKNPSASGIYAPIREVVQRKKCMVDGDGSVIFGVTFVTSRRNRNSSSANGLIAPELFHRVGRGEFDLVALVVPELEERGLDGKPSMRSTKRLQ